MRGIANLARMVLYAGENGYLHCFTATENVPGSATNEILTMKKGEKFFTIQDEVLLKMSGLGPKFEKSNSKSKMQHPEQDGQLVYAYVAVKYYIDAVSTGG